MKMPEDIRARNGCIEPAQSRNAGPQKSRSSIEGLDVAKGIELQLENDAEVTVWKDGVLGLGKGTLESLVLPLKEFDFAILVLTPDNMIVSRD